jgi:hypothetical protein
LFVLVGFRPFRCFVLFFLQAFLPPMYQASISIVTLMRVVYARKFCHLMGRSS